ncbi:TPA: fimbrial protein [Salmonella enterica]|nr:fimbrial protein [Salmonella enterica]
MKHSILCVNLFILLAAPTFAVTTVNSEFEITNKVIEKASITSSEPSMELVDTGGGLYKIHDNYSDANINMMQYGNQQLGLVRENSLIKIQMTGEKLGHKFTVYAKYANSEIKVLAKGVAGFQTYTNTGCISVTPDTTLNDNPFFFNITSNEDVNSNCSAHTFDIGFPPAPTINVQGVSRDVYLDIGGLNKNKQYRDAPPDVYTGKSVYNGEVIKNRVGVGYRIYYNNNIKIIKNPYFERVTLPAGDNLFDVKTTGSDIHGSLVIPYVINGHFTPYNKINLNVTSLNGFKLKDVDSKNSIPYSLSTTIGGQKTYSLATPGAGNGGVTIDNLTNENYALQGRFNASFSIDKSLVDVGDYTDTLTAIFEIAL